MVARCCSSISRCSSDRDQFTSSDFDWFCHPTLQVEVKVIPHCPFWVFPIVNAVSKKSSLSHPFDGFPHVNARFTECFFYHLRSWNCRNHCILLVGRYSFECQKIWQRWENISWTGRTLFLTPGTQNLPPSQWHTGLPQAIRKLPQGPNPIGTLVPHHRWFGKTKYVKCVRAIANPHI